MPHMVKACRSLWNKNYHTCPFNNHYYF